MEKGPQRKALNFQGRVFHYCCSEGVELKEIGKGLEEDELWSKGEDSLLFMKLYMSLIQVPERLSQGRAEEGKCERDTSEF